MTPNERRFPFPIASPGSFPGLKDASKAFKPPFRVRAFGIPSEAYALAHVRQRIRFKLGKFALHIKGLEIRIKKAGRTSDEPWVACSLSVILDTGTPVPVERFAHDALEAFDHAMGVAERMLRRTIQRNNHR